MKNFFNKKRIVSLVLTLTMLFAMSSMAFAQSSAQTTVNISLRSLNKSLGSSFTVTVPSDKTLYEALVIADSEKTDLAISWKDVAVLDPTTWQPTGEIGKAITSIQYKGKTYTNRDSYPTPNSYEGEAWMYYLGTKPANTDLYPKQYLSQLSVSGTTTQASVEQPNNKLTLSFESLKFSW